MYPFYPTFPIQDISNPQHMLTSILTSLYPPFVIQNYIPDPDSQHPVQGSLKCIISFGHLIIQVRFSVSPSDPVQLSTLKCVSHSCDCLAQPVFAGSWRFLRVSKRALSSTNSSCFKSALGRIDPSDKFRSYPRSSPSSAANISAPNTYYDTPFCLWLVHPIA